MYERYKTTQKHFWHPMDPTYPSNNGITLIITSDVGNNQMIDGVGGLWNVNVGHNHPQVKTVINKQMNELSYYQMLDGIAHPELMT